MSKRTRNNDGNDLPVTKRSRRIPGGGLQPSLDQMRLCYEIFESLKYHKTEDGKLLCESFFKAPSRRIAPDYYKVISNPIDLTRIQQKIKTEEYETTEQFSADIQLLVENAKSFYKRATPEYKDACEMWEVFVDKRTKATEGETLSDAGRSRDTSPSPSIRSFRSESPGRSTRSKDTSPGRFSVSGNDPVDPSVLEELLVCVMELIDETGRLISPPFRLLPSRQEYPEYYVTIQDPIDLKIIAQRIRDNRYRSLNDVERALSILCKNAKIFNEPGSMIFKDATAIRKFVSQRKMELLETAVRPIEKERSEHNNEVVEDLLKQTETEAETNELSEDSEEDEETEKSSNPLWQLYWTIRTYTHPNDDQLFIADAFCQLPNRNWYPDYYDEVKDPVSLFMVNKRLKRGEYKNIKDLLDDLNLVFVNAKSYNIEGSEIYDSACRLQSLAVRRAKELDQHLDTSLYPTEIPPSEAPPGSFGTPPPAKLAKVKREPNTDGVKGRPGRKTLDELMQRYRAKLMLVWSAIVDYRDPECRLLSQFFMELPSAKIYPNYFQVIPEPIDLNMIRRNIETDKYSSSAALVTDVELLFNNARHFNEPHSEIYNCANNLHTVFRNAVKGLGPMALESPRVLKEKFGRNKSKSNRRPLSNQQHQFSNRQPKKRGRHRLNCGCPGCQIEDSKTLIKPIKKRLLSNEQHQFSNRQPKKRGRHRLSCGCPGCRFEDPKIEPIKLIKKNARWSKTRAPCGQNVKQMASAMEKGGRSSNPGTPTGAVEKSTPKRPPQQHSQLSAMTPDQKKLWTLYTAIRDFIDQRGRKLATAFLKLPARNEYPDYYEVIKKPMDLTKIGNRMSSNQYESLDTLAQDFILMFDNACRYNEPESVIYKDALSLQKVLIQKKAELGIDNNDSVPDVQACVQELLTNLFITVHNHQDDEGRCYSDSLFEVAELLKQKGITERPLTLDQIKRNLDKGRYRRLDRFQEDMFEVFEKARVLSRSDSQLFEDAVELQWCFIKTRDDLCRVQDGEWLLSPARYYAERGFLASVDLQRKEKQHLEQQEDACKPIDPKMSPSKVKACDTQLEHMKINQIEYQVGDFAYVQAADDEPTTERHIIRIERIWHDEDENLDLVSGNWFYKPHQTYHLATRKFLEKEVFKSVFYDNVVASRLLGKCYIMFIRDYFKYKPKGFDENNVYVCESKYLGRQLHFKKMKQWPYDADDDDVEYEERDNPLIPIRVSSVFINQGRAMMNPDEMKSSGQQESEDKDEFTVLDKPKEEIVLEGAPGPDGLQYYEQMSYNQIWYKLGEAAYVNKPEKDLPDVIRIDKMWRNTDGDAFLSGPWFARPFDVEHEPTRMFLKRELFGTEQPDSVVPFTSVVGRAVVLTLKDFCSMRPTELREQDVFVCQHKVLGRGAPVPGLSCSLSSFPSTADLQQVQGQPQDSNASLDGDSAIQSPPPPSGAPMSESSARRLRNIKSYKLSDKVLEDEIFYFKKAITPEKEASPLLMKTDTTVDVDALSATDFNESSSEIDPSETQSHKDLYGWLATQPKLNSRSKSGYILFSAEIRKRIMNENPNSSFGEISKMVGTEWKKLTEEEKKQYEVRASIIAEEREKADALAGPPLGQRPAPGQIRIFCCKWQGCDFQFETSDLLYEHITTSHTSQIMEVGENQFVCLWQSCAKYRKDGKPFPSLPRLHRHMKEKHMPTTGKCIFPNQRSKNFVGLSHPAEPATPQQQVRQAYAPGTPGYGQQQVFYTQQPMVDAHGQMLSSPHVQQQVVVAPVYQVQQGQQAGQQQQPLQQVVQVTQASQQQVQTVVVQQPYQGDPGKRIVQAPAKPPEPVFVAPPDSQKINRVLHSEVYLRYIESLYADKGQNTVSKWSRSLGAGPHNTPPPSSRPATADWLNLRPGTSHDDVTQALWNLRTHMLKESLGIEKIVHHSQW